MGKAKEPKGKEERLQEGIHLLNQLKERGFKPSSMGYLTIKQHITDWIQTGEPFEDTLRLDDYNSTAEITLPRYTNRTAGIHLKAIKHPTQ
jgi:hypothetical protein